jgi:hypothetical protein
VDYKWVGRRKLAIGNRGQWKTVPTRQRFEGSEVRTVANLIEMKSCLQLLILPPLPKLITPPEENNCTGGKQLHWQNGVPVRRLSAASHPDQVHSEKCGSEEKLQESKPSIAIQGSMQDLISIPCRFRKGHVVSRNSS